MLFADCGECERDPSSFVGGGERTLVTIHPVVLNVSGSLRLATSGGLFPSLVRRHKGAPICQHMSTMQKNKCVGRGKAKGDRVRDFFWRDFRIGGEGVLKEVLSSLHLNRGASTGTPARREAKE